MAKFKKEQEYPNFNEGCPPMDFETVEQKAIVADVKSEVKLFVKIMWKGIVPVYKCVSCGHCENKKDDIILHVLIHVDESKRNKLFEKLAKEY